MNLSDYRTRLQDFYGSNLADDDAFLNRIINDSYRELAAIADWWWLESSELLRFEAPMTALTVVAAVGTADIVPSGTAYVGTAYTLGWAATGDRTFRVSAIDAASPYTITLDGDWPDASATTTVQLWNDMLTLSSDCDWPVAISPRNDPNNLLLRQVDQAQIESYGANLSGKEQEIAREFAFFREPTYTSSSVRIRIFPPPDEIAEYQCRYRAFAAEMANDTASTLLPTKHEMTLVNLATMKLAKIRREDPDIIAYYADEYNRSLAAMLEDQNRLGSTDARVKLRGLSQAAMAMPFRLTNVTQGGV